MVQTLRHRGPDDSGIAEFESCVLGHTRLSIVDISTGQQPMYSPSRDVCIVFNGEIYGYKDVRDGLAGYPFRTSSDTEVILALYATHGPDFVGRLPGMFAFGLWDESKQAFHAARDRFGEKPFYYAFGRGGEFLFASEIKTILRSGLLEPRLDMVSLTHVLKNLYVPPERTIYENVFSLPPAPRLEFVDGRVNVRRYWEMPATRPDMDLGTAVEEFRRLFERSVRNQLIADVPVGAFLSGGLDSSTVVAVASKFTSKLSTFSFGFEDAENEHHFARGIADRYGTDHHELTAENIDIPQLLSVMDATFDEPLADSSNIPTYLISKLARKSLKVILSGDGADELFGGYHWWYRPLTQWQEDRRPSLPEDVIIRVIARLTKGLGAPSAGYWQHRRARSQVRRDHASVISAHSGKPVQFTEAELFGMLPGVYPGYRPRTGFDWQEENDLNDALKYDLSTYLPGDILVKVDRASMAHGLELRAPFLDRDFVEFGISLPSRMKFDKQKDKIILRESYQADWTDQIRKRGKAGFGAPVTQWLRRPAVRDFKIALLDDPRKRIFSLFSFEKTRQAAAEDSQRTWILLVLALWFENRPQLVTR
jgi:asparagine synthase (glutamine-hydrolysing)